MSISSAAAAILAVLASAFLSACGASGSSLSAEIVGKWACTLNNGEQAVEIYSANGEANFPGQPTGTYTVSGDKVTVMGSTGMKIISTVSIQGNTLHVTAFSVVDPSGAEKYHTDNIGKSCTKQP